MAIIEFDVGISVGADGRAYVGRSYREAQLTDDVTQAFYFDSTIAVPGKGFWIGGAYSTDPITDTMGYAVMSYDLDRSFSVELTSQGKAQLEQELGEGYKILIDYSLLYTAINPDVPAYSFGPHPWELSGHIPGPYSVQEGYMSSAEGIAAHAEGYSTSADGDSSHAEGTGAVAYGDYSHAEGYHTRANFDASHAEGYGTTAQQSYSHAEGYRTTAVGNASHAEGSSTTAGAPNAHAEGSSSSATGGSSHAEGLQTIASKSSAHAEGYKSSATGGAAHAEGINAVAAGDYSHAQNSGTYAAGNNQTALGRYNVVDANGQYAAIIGNGTSDSARSNALTVKWSGDVECGTVNGVDLTQLPLIQRGTISPAAHTASSSDSAAITFADEFSASPTVVVGIRGQTQTEGMGRCSAWASNVSATGFTLNFRNDFTSSRTFGAYWVAVGGGTAGGSGGGGDTSALEQRIAELEADMQALAEATAYVGANHISIEGTTVSDALNPITSGTIDGLEI